MLLNMLFLSFYPTAVAVGWNSLRGWNRTALITITSVCYQSIPYLSGDSIQNTALLYKLLTAHPEYSRQLSHLQIHTKNVNEQSTCNGTQNIISLPFLLPKQKVGAELQPAEVIQYTKHYPLILT